MATYLTERLRLTGIKEIKQTLNAMSAEINGPELYAVMGGAVRPIRDQARANAASFSGTVAASVYIADKQPPSRPQKKTVLVVAHKKDTMREWTASRNNRSPQAKVAAGGRVAESLGTMFELGTSRGMKGHLWFRRAIDSRKGEAIANLKAGFLALIERACIKNGVPVPTMPTRTQSDRARDSRGRYI